MLSNLKTKYITLGKIKSKARIIHKDELSKSDSCPNNLYKLLNIRWVEIKLNDNAPNIRKRIKIKTIQNAMLALKDAKFA